MNTELQDAIDWYLKNQIKETQTKANWHQGLMGAAVVGEGHRQALQEENLKLEALQRFQANPSLMSEKMRNDILNTYRGIVAQMEERKRQQKAAAEEQAKKHEADVLRKIEELNAKGIQLNPGGGIQHRTYIRDINC